MKMLNNIIIHLTITMHFSMKKISIFYSFISLILLLPNKKTNSFSLLNTKNFSPQQQQRCQIRPTTTSSSLLFSSYSSTNDKKQQEQQQEQEQQSKNKIIKRDINI